MNRFQLLHHGSFEPGKWAQYDFSDGPVVGGVKTTLFHFYLPYSRHRLVQRIPDQSLPNVIAALHTCSVMVGGVPRYVLTDNAKTAATTHVAGIGVLERQDGQVRQRLRV